MTYIKAGDRVAHLDSKLGGGTVERVFKQWQAGKANVSDFTNQVIHVAWDSGEHGIHPVTKITKLIIGQKGAK